MTLKEGRAAFEQFGAVEERFVSKVRPPKGKELPENQPRSTSG
jgi:hypothetical protein